MNYTDPLTGYPATADMRPKAGTRSEHVRELIEEGIAACARKVGEEAVEASVAALAESDERVVEEIADLWFHSYVLLAARGLDPDDVEAELRRRVR